MNHDISGIASIFLCQPRSAHFFFWPMADSLSLSFSLTSSFYFLSRKFSSILAPPLPACYASICAGTRSDPPDSTELPSREASDWALIISTCKFADFVSSPRPSSSSYFLSFFVRPFSFRPKAHRSSLPRGGETITTTANSALRFNWLHRQPRRHDPVKVAFDSAQKIHKTR